MPSSPALRCKHIRNPLWDELGSAFRVLAAPADADLLACDIKNTVSDNTVTKLATKLPPLACVAMVICRAR